MASAFLNYSRARTARRTIAQEAARIAAGKNSEYPYVDANNNVIGTCNTAKLLFCRHGIEEGNTVSHRRLRNAANHDSVTNSALSFVFDEVGTKIYSQSAGNALAIPRNGTWQGLLIPPTSDILLAVAAEHDGAPTSLSGIVINTNSPGDECSMGCNLGTANPIASWRTGASGVEQIQLPAVGDVVDGQNYVHIVTCDRDGNTTRIKTGGTAAEEGSSSIASAPLTGSFTLDDDANTLFNFRGLIAMIGLFEFPNHSMPTDAAAQISACASAWLRDIYILPKGW